MDREPVDRFVERHPWAFFLGLFAAVVAVCLLARGCADLASSYQIRH